MDDPLNLLANTFASAMTFEEVAEITGATDPGQQFVDAMAAGVDLSAPSQQSTVAPSQQSMSPRPVRPPIPSRVVDTSASATRIQAAFRGFIYRAKRLPLIFYKIAAHLKEEAIVFSNATQDGRVNSSLDESTIVKSLVNKFGDRIKVYEKQEKQEKQEKKGKKEKQAKNTIRHWNDIGVFDSLYGWLPVNIKSTTMENPDNAGNMAMCVHAYTDKILNIEHSYTNGPMSEILIEKIKNGAYNRSAKKDYYFIVLNKEKPGDVIINSVRGLTKLTPNLSNPPFQVDWDKNRVFHYKNIRDSVRQFVETLQKPKPHWSEPFMAGIRALQL